MNKIGPKKMKRIPRLRNMDRIPQNHKTKNNLFIKRDLNKRLNQMQEEEKQQVKIVQAKVKMNQGFKPIAKRKNRNVSLNYSPF